MPSLKHKMARLLMRRYPFHCGQGRLIDRSGLRRLAFDEPTLKVRCSDGFEMTIIPNDHIGRHLYLTGDFDRTILDVLASFCTGGERILDVGANIGYIACGLLFRVPDCLVAAVEPQPAICQLMSRNIAEIGGARGVALQVAVSDRTGTGVMVVPPGNSAATHVVREGERLDDPNSVSAQFVTGERLFEMSRLDRVDLIKIDVEGHEETVLRALRPVIARFRPRAVLFEHVGTLDDPGNVIRTMFDDLKYDILRVCKRLTGWSLKPIGDGQVGHDYVAVCGDTASSVGACAPTGSAAEAAGAARRDL